MLALLLTACANIETDTDAITCWPATSYVMYTGDDCTGDAYTAEGPGGVAVDLGSVLTPNGTCVVDPVHLVDAIPACP